MPQINEISPIQIQVVWFIFCFLKNAELFLVFSGFIQLGCLEIGLDLVRVAVKVLKTIQGGFIIFSIGLILQKLKLPSGGAELGTTNSKIIDS